MTEAGSGWEEITGNVAIEVAGAFVPRHSCDFFLFLAFFWRAERQQPRQGWRVFRGRGDLPGSKRLVGLRAVCAVRHRLDPVARSSRASPWGTGGGSKLTREATDPRPTSPTLPRSWCVRCSVSSQGDGRRERRGEGSRESRPRAASERQHGAASRAVTGGRGG